MLNVAGNDRINDDDDDDDDDDVDAVIKIKISDVREVLVINADVRS